MFLPWGEIASGPLREGAMRRKHSQLYGRDSVGRRKMGGADQAMGNVLEKLVWTCPEIPISWIHLHSFVKGGFSHIRREKGKERKSIYLLCKVSKRSTTKVERLSSLPVVITAKYMKPYIFFVWEIASWVEWTHESFSPEPSYICNQFNFIIYV